MFMTIASSHHADYTHISGSKNYHRLFSPSLFQLSADFISFALVFLLYYMVRFTTGWFSFTIEPESSVNVLALMTLSLYWFLLFWFSGLYKNWYIRSPFDEFFTVVRISFIGCCILGVAILWDDSGSQGSTSRYVIILYWVLFVLIVCCGRLFARSMQRSLREKGVITIPVLLVGTVVKLKELLTSITNSPALGYKPLGIVVRNQEEYLHRERFVTNGQVLPMLGSFSMLPDILMRVAPHEVLVALDNPEHEELLQMASDCTERNVQMKILPDLYEIFSGQARTMQIYGTPLIEVSPELLKPWEEVAKRALDIVVSIVVLIVGLPAWLLIAVLVKLDSVGPVFFSQERVGKGSQPFIMYKFRSMTTDAEKNGPQWAKVNDPRVTRLGRFLRKSHIDEVPQFWNVLLGDMSLVGPRPERPFYVEKFSREIPYYPRRLKVRPGITGWYQIKYRAYTETLEEVRNRLRYDFFYIENMSFKLDLEILIRTVIRVFKGHGQA